MDTYFIRIRVYAQWLRNSLQKYLFMSLINIIVLSFQLLVDFWDVFAYGRGCPHVWQVCCDTRQSQHFDFDVVVCKVLFPIFILTWRVINYVSRPGKGIDRRNESTELAFCIITL